MRSWTFRHRSIMHTTRPTGRHWNQYALAHLLIAMSVLSIGLGLYSLGMRSRPVSGTVKYLGRPIQFCVVVLVDQRRTGVHGKGTTNARGEYVVDRLADGTEGVPNGSYTVLVYVPGVKQGKFYPATLPSKYRDPKSPILTATVGVCKREHSFDLGP